MKKYPLFKVHVPVDEAMVNIRHVLESGFINEGEQVTQLTKAMRLVLKSDQLLLVNSCTSAITLALRLAEVGGQQVITTPMTCVASNMPIINEGATLVWSDVDPDTGMVGIRELRELEGRLQHVQAILVVAWAGNPPPLRELREFCDKHHKLLILDAAHAFGALYEGKPIHEWADFTCYSFQAIKHITTGDGGALVCRSKKHFERAKAIKWFGLDRDKAKDEKGDWKGQQWDVDIHEAGYKFNMNNLTAAVGLAQLPYIDFVVDSHRKNAQKYDSLFQGAKTVRPVPRDKNAESSFWVYTMLLENSSITRDKLLSRLNKEGIMAGVVHVPNHSYGVFSSSLRPLPGVDKFSLHQFSLPCGWWLKEDEIQHIANRVIELSK